MKIFLIGYMGSGKSTIGRELSSQLNLPWIDLDDEFELRYKISITNFFHKYGEIAFRELEHKLLVDFFLVPDLVISTGGGTPCFLGNMELMNNNGITIYLSATPEFLLSRIESSTRKRPLFQLMNNGNISQNIFTHLSSREYYYNQSKIIIDAQNPETKGIITQILKYLETLPANK